MEIRSKVTLVVMGILYNLHISGATMFIQCLVNYETYVVHYYQLLLILKIRSKAKFNVMRIFGICLSYVPTIDFETVETILIEISAILVCDSVLKRSGCLLTTLKI